MGELVGYKSSLKKYLQYTSLPYIFTKVVGDFHKSMKKIEIIETPIFTEDIEVVSESFTTIKWMKAYTYCLCTRKPGKKT